MSDVKCSERLYAFDSSSRDYRDYSNSPSLPAPETANDDPAPSSQYQPDSLPSLTADSPSNDDFLPEAADSDLSMDVSSSSNSLSMLSLSRDETEQRSIGQRKVISIHAPNPSHLFWVPATQHPEIAPAEFEKFLQADAIARRERASLKRRSSILSVSFTASDAAKQGSGGVEDGNRRRQQQQQRALEINSIGADQSIGDQGLLDAESEAQRKTRLRRSISLDTAKAADAQLRLPDFLVFDRNSSPLDQSQVLVPRADRPSLLRRGARTKFHRNSAITPSSSGRPVDRHRQAESMPPISFDKSDFGGVTLSDATPPPPRSSFPPSPAPSNNNANASVADSLSTRPSSLSPPRPELQRRASAEELTRQRRQQQQDDELHSVTDETESPPPILPSPPASARTVPAIVKYGPETSQLEPPERVERKSSSWSWGFRKSKSEQLRHQESSPPSNPTQTLTQASTAVVSGRKSPEPRPSVSSDSGGGKLFGLSSLFSRKTASGKVQPTSYSSTTVPKDFQLNKINQNRLPIHIERAVYRLSHTKLANPRRPLHEQVLISNLMFWYLSIVSSSQPASGSPVESSRKFINAGKKGKRRPSSKSKQQQQQQQQQRVGKGAPPQEQKNAALHQYMSSNASTGFVIPENYLKPQTGPKHRKPSLSDSDDDDDDDEDEQSSSSSSSSGSEDDERSSGNMSATARKTKAWQQQKPNKAKKAFSSLQKHTHSASKVKDGADDDIPLAMYRKKQNVK